MIKTKIYCPICEKHVHRFVSTEDDKIKSFTDNLSCKHYPIITRNTSFPNMNRDIDVEVKAKNILHSGQFRLNKKIEFYENYEVLKCTDMDDYYLYPFNLDEKNKLYKYRINKGIESAAYFLIGHGIKFIEQNGLTNFIPVKLLNLKNYE